MLLHSLIDLIGNTPLLDVSALLPRGCARLVAKLEMFNPGGSIKDRPALAMIKAAEERGQLTPGMTIIDATAGNTGIGLALVANLKGYRSIFFVPDRMSQEKICAMRLYGAKVHLLPRDLGMRGCMEAALGYAETHGKCFVVRQFENPANPNQAECILGPEIGDQLGCFPDGLAIGAGSGGTFSGLSRWLKKHNPVAECWLVQPEGSVFSGGERRPYEIEGIGNSFIPDNLALNLAARVVDVPDSVSFKRCAQLAHRFGLLAAGSSGANLEASIQLAHKLGEGRTVVTVFSDQMERYVSKPWVQDLAKGSDAAGA